MDYARSRLEVIEVNTVWKSMTSGLESKVILGEHFA